VRYLLAALIAFIGEFYGSIIGGGGFIIQPFLIALGIPPHMTVANDVSAAIGSPIGSFFVYRKKRLFRFDILKECLPSLVLGTITGLLIFKNIPARFIEKFLACAAILFVIYTLKAKPALGVERKELPPNHKIKLVIFGFVFGAYMSISGAGTGTFGIYALTGLFGTTFLEALATLSILGFAAMGIGFIGYWQMGLIDLPLFLSLLSGATLAGICGSKMALLIGDKWLKPVFFVAIIGFSTYLALK